LVVPTTGGALPSSIGALKKGSVPRDTVRKLGGKRFQQGKEKGPSETGRGKCPDGTVTRRRIAAGKEGGDSRRKNSDLQRRNGIREREYSEQKGRTPWRLGRKEGKKRTSRIESGGDAHSDSAFREALWDGTEMEN